MEVRLEARELAWAPTAELPEVDDKMVQRWLDPWPELVGRPWQRLGGGLRSINLRIGDVVARIGVGEHALGKERRLLDCIEGVRVPSVIDARDHVLLLEYVPHEWLPATAEAGERVGAAAAAIHHRRYERGGLLESSLVVAQPVASVIEALHGWADPMLAGRAGDLLGSLGDAVRTAWTKERDEMVAAAAPVLVHADFKPMNIGWVPDSSDVVVFDWEFAWIGPAMFDLGQLLRWNPPAEFAHGVERGYAAAGGRLPAGWQRLAELFDLFNLIGFLDHPRACARRIADVLERVQQTVR